MMAWHVQLVVAKAVAKDVEKEKMTLGAAGSRHRVSAPV